MEKLKLYILTMQNSYILEIDNITVESYNFYFELVSTFCIVEKNEDGIGVEFGYIIMSENLRKSYRDFFNKYITKYKQLNKFKQILDCINDDEYFFIFNNDIEDTEQFLLISTALNACNVSNNDEERAKYFQDYMKSSNEVFKDFFKEYNILAFDSDSRKNIGNYNKETRICRFCGNGLNTVVKVTFNHKSHAIPESLGNKGLVCFEECDACNNKFGKTIEKDLISYFDFFRTFYAVSGKNGIPKLRFQNAEVFNITKVKLDSLGLDENNLIKTENLNIIVTTDECLMKDDNLKFNLKSNEEISMVNVYKALCKISISLINSKELQYLQKTIEWINNDTEKEVLPEVAKLISNKMFYEHPILKIYIRRNKDYRLPHLVGEFNFKCFTFVFILPFSNNDNKRFIEKEEYNYFWDFFNHYKSFKNWKFEDFSSIDRKKILLNMNFEKETKATD
ncbi:hypothetical protein PJV92_11575 [Aliarcobacter butzleri]|uniref:HNH endonuclease 5 domain-containing protein n=1 Tax=Aliarcobacter butzleri TaxID=28197 RepID=A0AAP4Q0K8_9BACT|nr:hypothetical protein [Aliarcobacter butzleri]MDN5051359.1 hypothetical protein [Aliarcobacter butzleri]MDN5074210.1 hypothetical protein [Aliarcobacter butzleri]MDN5115627.1 hypothetical protein [Aliarcobacter butzleri]MDN5133359.1 hypothetical protein [Aliarcobacter butzleri]